eukprot:TRINITY_DN14120_c0_g3_i1.p1 TRINITY_DN14120_c0_g3~~TRINITY_DN14120_c0_g3_i1.p1  ORF type:complete len:243 (-),score=11.24 TRINITY_DN14120_c0_g3_i1:211-939(-)
MDGESGIVAPLETLSTVTSETESEQTRDSVESLLERGNSYSAQSFDLEAYRFAQWWNALRDTGLVEQDVLSSRAAAPRQLYRRYATLQAHETVSSALQLPFVVRHKVKQDFFSVRLLFDHGVTFGGSTYHLTSELAEWVLSFLGHQEKAERPVCSPSNCIDFGALCPAFRHRTLRAGRCEHVAIGLQREASRSSSSSGSIGSDDESVVSTGSVSAAGDRLLQYLRSRRRLSAQSDAQVDGIA